MTDAPSTQNDFVCEVISGAAQVLPGERLTLQEAAVSANITNPEQALRFKLGRLSARRALAQFDTEMQRESILRGEGGEPLFPRAYVGSISHTEQTAAAVVGRADQFESLGLDIEFADRQLKRELLDKIGTAAEKKWVNQAHSKELKNERLLMIFSAKESIYKALYPLHRTRMKFSDVATTWNEEMSAFIGTLLTDFGAPWEAGAQFATLCRNMNGLIVAVTLVPVDQGESDQDDTQKDGKLPV